MICRDLDAGVRVTATVTLGGLEDASAIAALQAALATEQDPNVHSLMLSQLKQLQQSPFRITIKTASETVVAGALIELHDPPSIKSGETYTSTVFLDRVCDLSRPRATPRLVGCNWLTGI